MLERIQRRIQPLHPYAIGGAWFFVVFSVVSLLWVIAQKWPDPAGITKLYHTFVGEQEYLAVGLTYTGTAGLLLAGLQAVVIAGAVLATVLPGRFVSTRVRRIGHGVLCAWAALWAGNLLRLASLDHEIGSVAQAALLCGLLGCTIYRARCGWSAPRTGWIDPPAPQGDLRQNGVEDSSAPRDERDTPEETPNRHRTDPTDAPRWRSLRQRLASCAQRTGTLAREGYDRTRPAVMAAARKARDAGHRAVQRLRSGESLRKTSGTEAT